MLIVLSIYVDDTNCLGRPARPGFLLPCALQLSSDQLLPPPSSLPPPGLFPFRDEEAMIYRRIISYRVVRRTARARTLVDQISPNNEITKGKKNGSDIEIIRRIANVFHSVPVTAVSVLLAICSRTR